MMQLSGHIAIPAEDDLARVLVLDQNQRVVAETATDAGGGWSVDTPDDATGVLVHSFKNSLLAAHVPIADAGRIGLPNGHICTITCTGASDGASYAFHPVSLSGLSDDKTALLRNTADGTLRTDVASWTCGTVPRVLILQDGRYMVSGGLMSLGELLPPGIALSAVSVNGAAVPPDAFDTFDVPVTEPLEVRLTFKQLEGAP